MNTAIKLTNAGKFNFGMVLANLFWDSYATLANIMFG
jgi:hypothetical protein